MANKVYYLSILAIFFLLIGSVWANDNSSNDFLENVNVSSNSSISETSLVNSQNIDIKNINETQKVASNEITDKNNVFSDNSYKLAVKDTTLYYKNGTKFIATVYDENNVPISNQNVLFSVIGKNYSITTDKDGIAFLDIHLLPGKYDIVTSYNDISVKNSVEVLSTIESKDLVKYFKNNTQYGGTFLNSYGKPLTNSVVYFNINGIMYKQITDNKGIATLNINLNPGNYVVTAINPLNNEMRSNNITVLSTISGDNVVKYYKNNTNYQAKFFNSAGNPLNDIQVSFNVRGKIYQITTDNEGVANLPINLNPGKYIVTAINPINNQMYSNNITVLSTISSSNLVKYFKNNTPYQAKFLAGNGNPFENEIIQFNVNGIFYKIATDDKGIARLPINLNPGSYIVTAINPLNNEMVSNNITVLSTISGDNVVKYYKNNTQYYTTFKDLNGNFLSNRIVNFNINGIFYNVTTNNKGIAILSIDLNPGSYVVTAINPLNNEMHSNEILILKAKTIITGSNTQCIYDKVKNYTISLNYEDGAPIQNQKIYFNINNKTFTAITDNNGIASVLLSDLKLGRNVIDYKFVGDDGFESSNNSKIINVINSTTVIESNDLIMEFGQKSSFNLTLKDLNNIPLANKQVTFKIIGKTYNINTDNNGIASININLIPGTYLIEYIYSSDNTLEFNQGFNEIIVNKKTAVLKSDDLVMEYKDGSKFNVFVCSEDGTPINGAAIKFKIIGKEYLQYSDKNGIASLNINLITGNYSISCSIEDDMFLKDFLISNQILVNGSIITSNKVYGFTNSITDFNVKLSDAYGKPVVGVSVKFYISNGKTLFATTDTNGIASIKLNNLKNGNYQVSYYCTDSKGRNLSGMNSIYITTLISINSLIEASKNVKNYIESNYELPKTVNIGGTQYSTSQFLYLISLAIVNIKNNDFKDISSIEVKSPTNPIGSLDLDDLYTYVSLSKSVVDYILKNGIAPNSMHSDVGTIGYESLIFALARVVAFYGDNNVLPTYTAIKSIQHPLSVGPLDSVNTIKDLTNYRQSSKNCQINNAAIKSLANSLTAGLTGELAKAKAIYNYVRNNIHYSYYYNTKYGATGTLTYKTGNCCDQAHLVVALCRASGLAARYVHGTCIFSSGNTYGHVWAQILVGNVWMVADPTSSRNSLGVVNNWYSSSCRIHGYYYSLNF